MKIEKKIFNRRSLKLLVIGAACLAFAAASWSAQKHGIAKNNPPDGREDFKPDAAKSKAAFLEAYKVFMSPRCANCHPAGDTPSQYDTMTPHTQGVTRGPDGKGKYGMKCTTCHQAENLEGEHLPPGVPTGWHMPPANMKMVFQGRTAKQLCEQFKDPLLNGGKKTLSEAMEHLEKDPLVLWGWSPGNNRNPPPLSREEFMKNVHTWVENGGACPE